MRVRAGSNSPGKSKRNFIPEHSQNHRETPTLKNTMKTPSIFIVDGGAGCRRWLALGQDKPEAQPVVMGQRGEAGFQIAEGGGGGLACGGQRDGHRAVLQVGVAFNEARLQHPIQQFAEAALIFVRLFRGAIHAISLALRAAKLNRKPEAA